MNREIKFRLIKDNKIVGYEKHTQNKGIFRSSIFHSKIDGNEIGYEWNNIVILSDKVIDYDYKEQYTGLKDKNGVEIYEGDIVQHIRSYSFGDDYHTGEPIDEDRTSAIIGVIRFMPSTGFVINGNKKTVSDIEDHHMETVKYCRLPSCMVKFSEIIGNIHEVQK